MTERLAIWVAAPPGEQESLVAADPEVWFRPPYVGGRGWLGVRLDRSFPSQQQWRALSSRRADRSGTCSHEQGETAALRLAELVRDGAAGVPVTPLRRAAR